MSSPDQPERQPAEPVISATEAEPQGAADVVDRIRDAVDALQTVDGRPVGEHADVYQRLHVTLQDALAEIDGA